MTIAGDIETPLRRHMSIEDARTIAEDIFKFLRDGNVISRLSHEGVSRRHIAAYLECIAILADIVPTKRPKAP